MYCSVPLPKCVFLPARLHHKDKKIYKGIVTVTDGKVKQRNENRNTVKTIRQQITHWKGGCKAAGGSTHLASARLGCCVHLKGKLEGTGALKCSVFLKGKRGWWWVAEWKRYSHEHWKKAGTSWELSSTTGCSFQRRHGVQAKAKVRSLLRHRQTAKA